MEFDFRCADLAEREGVPIELPARSIRIGEAIIAIASLKSRKPWIFPILATSKEVLECLVKPSQDIL